MPQGTLRVNPCGKIDACKDVTGVGDSSCCLTTNFSTGSTVVSCGTLPPAATPQGFMQSWFAHILNLARMLFAGAVGSHTFTTALDDPDLQIGMIQQKGSHCGYVLEPDKQLQLSIAFECDHHTPDPGVLS